MASIIKDKEGNCQVILFCLSILQFSITVGCVNDVKNLSKFLIERHGFSVGSDSMVILTDEAKDPNFIPTRRNIINAMQWLVAGVRPGDSLFFHFSGHGSQVKDRDGDEDDGYDEVFFMKRIKSVY